jgi:hypothetical protein
LVQTEFFLQDYILVCRLFVKTAYHYNFCAIKNDFIFRAGGRQLPPTPANRRPEAAQLLPKPANRRLETAELHPTGPNRRLEAALNKFTDLALPFHLHMIAQHRSNIIRVSSKCVLTNIVGI